MSPLPGRRARALLLPLAWLVLAGAPSAVPVAAQAGPLDEVEELARLGRTEEAREALARWWEGSAGGASRQELQRGVWLRGRLTIDPEQATLDFQRLVVLYPNGRYTAQALLRLAQAAHAQGDLAAADRYVATLARDYPDSQIRAEAEAWLRSAGPPGPASPDTAVRPAAAPAGPPAATGRIRPAAGDAVPPAAVPLVWSVQFGAFADEDRAFALHRELVNAGLAARLVRVQGSAFYHVRIGRFATRAEADAQLQGVTQRGFTAAIVRDDRAEEVVLR